MSISEEDAREIARWWQEQEHTTFQQVIDQFAKVTQAITNSFPRDSEGRIEDDYFRGTEDAVQSIVEGFPESLQILHSQFDKNFDYWWYLRQKEDR